MRRMLALGLALAACGGAATETRRSARERLDLAVNRYYGRDYRGCAAETHAVIGALPENDVARDTAQFYLAASLDELGFSQAAAELYLELVAARRSPELAARSLTALDKLARRRLVDERRLIDALFGTDYGDLPDDTTEFVTYYEGLGELRRGYKDWGLARIGELSESKGYYGYKARYALAVERLADRQDEGAAELLQGILDDDETPAAVLNDARLARARMLFEQKKYEEAIADYGRIEAPLPELDVVMLEMAWNQLAAEDERRTLGMLVGLDAPVYRRLFAPERALLRAMALRNLCQYRYAHLAVGEFRDKYRAVLERIRERQPLVDEPMLRLASLRRDDLVPTRRWQMLLEEERARLGRLRGEELRGFLDRMYQARLRVAKRSVERELEDAVDVLADQVLAVDEQMDILDYELGIGLFKPVGRGHSSASHGSLPAELPRGSENAYFPHDGEFWSDELRDFAVWVGDRCVR